MKASIKVGDVLVGFKEAVNLTRGVLLGCELEVK
jgi:hypothetical protein